MKDFLKYNFFPLLFVEGEGDEAPAGGDAPTGEGSGSDAGKGSGDDQTQVSLDADAEAAAAKPDPAEPKADVEEKEDWRDKRIAKLTAKLKESEQRAKPAPAAAADPKDPPLDPTADFNARVDAAAGAKLAEKEFADNCTAAAVAGQEKYGKDQFNSALSKLQRLVDPNDIKEVQSYNTMLQAALETGATEDLIYSLGTDLTKAQRVLEMSPVKMAVELAKMAAARPEPDAVSNAPKPIRPVGGNSGDRGPIDPTDKNKADTLSTKEWMARREKQLKEANAR